MKANNKKGTIFTTQYPKNTFDLKDFNITLKELGKIVAFNKIFQ